jgi:putative DNA primase/helicase
VDRIEVNTTTATTPNPLRTSDHDRFVRFRIPTELIEAAGITRVTDRQAHDLGIQFRGGDLSGIAFPIKGVTGSVTGYRVRRDKPEIEAGKPKAKYVQSVDRPSLYLTPTTRQWLSDTSVPVIFVEAYTSALAVDALCARTQRQFLAIGTAGCWGWRGRIGKAVDESGNRVNEKGPLPDLDAIPFDNRQTFIAFDSNVNSNKSVRVARRKFAEELSGRGAKVRLVTLLEENGINGPDDFLALYSDEELLRIIDDAPPFEPVESPFRHGPDGVRRKVEREDKDTNETVTDWIWLCSPLAIQAETRDASGEEWGRLLVVTDRDKREHEWAMPMSMLAGDGARYRERLLSLGLVMAPRHWARESLHEFISTARPERRARCVPRTGWHLTPNGRVYVLPDQTFGRTAGERVLLQTTAADTHLFNVSGSLNEWNREIGRPCIGNSRLILAVSTAFAAALVELSGEPSGGIHFYGGSRTGKSTTARVGGSVWGGGGVNGYLRTWRATSNGLESVAASHCDALLCLDEMGQVDPTEAGEIAYMLSNGAGKSRARKDGLARRSQEWRLLFISTGEVTLGAKMMEQGRRVKAGQEVRLVDVSADAGRGLGIFENLHGVESADAFARRLYDSTLKLYGSPIRAFLEQVVMDLDDIGDVIRKAREAFISQNVPSDASGQVQSVAGRFALMAAAGTLATAIGILPWPEEAASEGVGTCFQAWLEKRGTSGDGETRSGISQIRRFIEQHGESRFTEWDGGPASARTINRAGFRRTTNGMTDWFVLPETFRSELCIGHDPKNLAKVLVQRKLLIPGNDGRPASLHRLPGTSKPSRVYHFSSEILEGTDV